MIGSFIWFVSIEDSILSAIAHPQARLYTSNHDTGRDCTPTCPSAATASGLVYWNAISDLSVSPLGSCSLKENAREFRHAFAPTAYRIYSQPYQTLRVHARPGLLPPASHLRTNQGFLCFPEPFRFLLGSSRSSARFVSARALSSSSRNVFMSSTVFSMLSFQTPRVRVMIQLSPKS